MKKDNNELERHHINPALILKRFKDKDGRLVRFLKNDFLFNSFIKKNHNHYCSEDSNTLIVKKLNFFSELAIIEINKMIQDNGSKPIKITSLESSYNYYEDLMGKFLDEYLYHNKNISDFHYDIIGSYIEISELRSLKFFNNINLCPIIDSNPYSNFAQLLKIIISYNDLSNMDGLNLNEQAVYINILIHFLNHSGFKVDDGIDSSFLTILMTDFIKIYNLINNNIIKRDIVKTNKKEINVFETQDSSFITSDNPVISIYRNNNPFIFDIIAEDLFEDYLKINKLTFLTISPNSMIVKTDNESIMKDKILRKDIVKRINTLILYRSDVWFISDKTLIGEKDKIELFNFIFYGCIEERCFYNQKICNLLNTINYYSGNFSPNIIFDFNITNPLKMVIQNINSSLPIVLYDDPIIETEFSGNNFIFRTYKNSINLEIYWFPDEATMKFIQSLNYEYSFLIIYKIREIISKYLNYSPIKDQLEFIKLDKQGIVREVHTIKDYAVDNKNKLLNCIRYNFLKAT